MRIRFKPGWSGSYPTLTPGNVYRVLGIEGDLRRIMNDLGEPILYRAEAFDLVDANLPSDWIDVPDADGARYARPAEFDRRGFFEAWHDGDRAAQSAVRWYLHRASLREAETLEDPANSYLRLRWQDVPAGGPSVVYSELERDSWEVRRVEVFADGRMGWANWNGGSDGTEVGAAPLPPLNEIAANPDCEVVAISRAEFQRVWDDVISRDDDEGCGRISRQVAEGDRGVVGDRVPR